MGHSAHRKAEGYYPRDGVFYKYYSLKITNTSNSDVTFTPSFNYTTPEGTTTNSLTHDNGNQELKIASGETIEGNLTNNKNLILFKEFTVGNSGRKASDAKNILNSISINY